jgi:hypothetical protein
MEGNSGGNSNFGGNGPVDVRCVRCSWVGSFASFISSPTNCTQTVESHDRSRHPDGFERCGGQLIPMDMGGRKIDHYGR